MSHELNATILRLNRELDEKEEKIARLTSQRDEAYEWLEEYGKNIREGMLPAERERMIKTHRFVPNDDENEGDYCLYCKLESDWFDRRPEYCEDSPPLARPVEGSL